MVAIPSGKPDRDGKFIFAVESSTYKDFGVFRGLTALTTSADKERFQRKGRQGRKGKAEKN
jgi:hypothetical protein